MNALYADPLTGALHDYFGGLDDLAAHRVRFIGDPEARIAEDHLRILRFFRFTARFGAVDRGSADYAACVANATSLMALSRERIADEFMKLLSLPDPATWLRRWCEDGILRPVLPEIDTAGVAALRAHCRRAGDRHVARSLRRMLALLPNDAALADQVAARLRLSNKLRALHQGRARPIRCGDGRGAGLSHRHPGGARSHPAQASAFVCRHVTWLKAGLRRNFRFQGGDLIAMGLKAGPQVAKALQEVERQWIASGFPGEAETRVLADQILVSLLRATQ